MKPEEITTGVVYRTQTGTTWRVDSITGQKLVALDADGRPVEFSLGRFAASMAYKVWTWA